MKDQLSFSCHTYFLPLYLTEKAAETSYKVIKLSLLGILNRHYQCTYILSEKEIRIEGFIVLKNKKLQD